MWYYGLDPTMLIVLPGLILAMIAQARVRGTFDKYARIASRSGWTAAAMAQDMLAQAGVQDVRVEPVLGTLNDHYDPRDRVLRLSTAVYDDDSIAALGVAAHEVGHVLQDQANYAPLSLRSAFLPAANIGSRAVFPLFFLGLILSSQPLMWIGIGAFCLVLLFYLITLPVEFNASSRALLNLEAGGYLTQDENRAAAAVLRAAAWTYIASFISAALQLVRLLALSRGSRRRR